MASQNTFRCLSRQSIPVSPRTHPVIIFTSPFSTSQASHKKKPTAAPVFIANKAQPPPPIKVRRQPLPQKQIANFKNKKSRVAGKEAKAPAPGERKAFRKRIQLSNNSALEVSGTTTLDGQMMAAEESVGKVLSIPDAVVDQLRSLEAFKPTQSWGLFRQPHFLVRKETLDLVKKMDESVEKKEGLKCVVTGSRISGKSMVLLQAMSHALANNWVVLHVPEGQDLVLGQTEYAPIPETMPMQFALPVYTQKLLQNILKANAPVLETLQLQKDWSALSHVKDVSNLADLVRSSKESEQAWPTLAALWTELTLPGRPPVLFALDGLNHINKPTGYLDPSANPVYAHDISVLRVFVDALSGKTALPNGGAVIGATSANNAQRHASQELVFSQLEAGQAGREVPLPDPYERKYDDRAYDALKNSWLLRVEGVPKEQARSLMEYWGASGIVRNALDSRAVSEKWALGGHGNVGEMERATLMTMKM